MGWSREQAIEYFVEIGGDAPGFATREVERYCATPGQACSYKLGHTVWTNARVPAHKQRWARKYDIKDFHEAGLDCGRGAARHPRRRDRPLHRDEKRGLIARKNATCEVSGALDALPPEHDRKEHDAADPGGLEEHKKGGTPSGLYER